MAASAYEELRRKQLEENKKRMAELNIHKLAQSLHTPKPAPVHYSKSKFSSISLNLCIPIPFTSHLLMYLNNALESERIELESLFVLTDVEAKGSKTADRSQFHPQV